MQTEINRTPPRVAVRISGINIIGSEDGVPNIVMGRSIPLVQDDMTATVQTRWSAGLRELWVCDVMGRPVEIIDLNTRPLSEMMHYTFVRDRILAAAR